MDYLFALQTIREAGPDIVNYIFLFISECALYLGALITAIIYWSVNKEDGAYIFMGYTGAFGLNQIIKNLACIHRPWILDPRLHVDPLASSSATGYSFPSGHTTSAASFYGGFAIAQRKKTWFVCLMSLCILLTAFSRNWLGAHTMKDVLVAIIDTCLVLCLVNILRYFVSRNPKLDTLVLIFGSAITILMLLLMIFKPYPQVVDLNEKILVDPKKMVTDCFSSAGGLLGFFTGWWLERHFVKFETQVEKKSKILRSVIGSVIMIFWLFLGSHIFKFMGDWGYHFMKYLCVMFFLMYLYPLIFTKIYNVKKSKKAA